ncbi:hypothetical protein, partial [Ruegeria marisrubri]|uniref:hypothetical protein n=1 Tax=Ruegeria marisrubri TaxID=1685379 RepID=UPI000AF56274
DDGAYTVALLGGEVADTSGNAVAADPTLASFTADSGDSTAPVVQSASAPDIGPAQVGTTNTDITVTFTDNVAIDTATIDPGDITVTGPGGALSVT